MNINGLIFFNALAVYIGSLQHYWTTEKFNIGTPLLRSSSVLFIYIAQSVY